MQLSVVIPAHNEEEAVAQTIQDICTELQAAGVIYEIIAVDDASTDNTGFILAELAKKNPRIKVIKRNPPCGFGRAVREGLLEASKDAVVIVMADASDDPQDILRYLRTLEQGYDCVFGSRFMRGAKIYDYPKLKLFLNRLANNFIKILFLRKENDITNAFKIYRREVIAACQPLISLHFNITVEIPLKAINRGFKIAQIPIKWYGRKSGVSKLKIRQLSRKYLFTIFYVWLEKFLLSDELREDEYAPSR